MAASNHELAASVDAAQAGTVVEEQPVAAEQAEEQRAALVKYLDAAQAATETEVAVYVVMSVVAGEVVAKPEAAVQEVLVLPLVRPHQVKLCSLMWTQVVPSSLPDPHAMAVEEDVT